MSVGTPNRYSDNVGIPKFQIPLGTSSAHVRLCTCTPPLTFVKRQANGSLTPAKPTFSAIRPAVPSYGKGGTYARPDVPHP